MNEISYTWEVSENTEIWGHDVFDTIEECIKDYLENYADENPNESIFVGEVRAYTVDVNGSSVIDNLEEQAYDECGEVAENWYPSSIKGIEKWDELDKQLTDVVTKWLEKHNCLPDFYNIINVREVTVR